MDEPPRRSPLGRRRPLSRRPLGEPSRLRSFALGGLVGAAGAIATARRLRTPPRSRDAATGLAAFEDAPCFLERDSPSYRDGGGDSAGERSNAE